MSDNVLIALITTAGGSVGAILLFLRRFLPPRPRTSGDVNVDIVWTEVRQLRTDLNTVVEDRDTYRETARILAAAFEAMTSAAERTLPPITFTAAEQQAIVRAKQRKMEDDATWPTLGGAHAPS